MSDKELDNLFNKKLEGFQASPSPEAWKNIEAGIRPGGINWKFYLSIAASLLLVGVITVLVIFPSADSDLFTASEEGTTVEQLSSPQIDVAELQEANENIPAQVEKEEVKPQQETKVETGKSSNASRQPVEKAKTPLVAVATETLSEKTSESDKQEEVSSKPAEMVASLERIESLEESTHPETTTPVVFTGEKVEVAVAAAKTSEEESQRGLSLKKVLEMARDFKSENDGWSSLREAKNELLTLGRKKNESSDE